MYILTAVEKICVLDDPTYVGVYVEAYLEMTFEVSSSALSTYTCISM